MTRPRVRGHLPEPAVDILSSRALEPFESPVSIQIAKAVKVIRAHLIDNDHKNESRRALMRALSSDQ